MKQLKLNTVESVHQKCSQFVEIYHTKWKKCLHTWIKWFVYFINVSEKNIEFAFYEFIN